MSYNPPMYGFNPATYGYAYHRDPREDERLAALQYSAAAQPYQMAPPPDMAAGYQQAQPMAPDPQREGMRPAFDDERQRYAGGLAAMRGRW